MTELNREELQFGNYKCTGGHPLWLVTENHARCEQPLGDLVWHFAWRFTPPRFEGWIESCLANSGRAWVSSIDLWSVEAVLAFIQRDIDFENAQGTVPQPTGPTLAEWREMQKVEAAQG